LAASHVRLCTVDESRHAQRFAHWQNKHDEFWVVQAVANTRFAGTTTWSADSTAALAGAWLDRTLSMAMAAVGGTADIRRDIVAAESCTAQRDQHRDALLHLPAHRRLPGRDMFLPLPEDVQDGWSEDNAPVVRPNNKPPHTAVAAGK
jgi:hypothetical protein